MNLLVANVWSKLLLAVSMLYFFSCIVHMQIQCVISIMLSLHEELLLAIIWDPLNFEFLLLVHIWFAPFDSLIFSQTLNDLLSTEWVWCMGDFSAKQCRWFTSNSPWFSCEGNCFPKKCNKVDFICLMVSLYTIYHCFLWLVQVYETYSFFSFT